MISMLVVSFSFFRSDTELPGWAITMETDNVSSDGFRMSNQRVFAGLAVTDLAIRQSQYDMTVYMSKYNIDIVSNIIYYSDNLTWKYC